MRMLTIGSIELMAMLGDRGIRWPKIVMPAHGEFPAAGRSIKQGAIEFLERPSDFGRLENSLKGAMAQLSAVNNTDEV